MKRCVLAIDAGSTGVRAVVVDAAGRVGGQAYLELAASYPSPVRVEQDPAEIWRKTREVAAGAMAAAGVTGEEVAAVGLTGQRSTAVAWSRATGEPLHAALSWQDLRASKRSGELVAEGFFVTPQAAAVKLEWLAREVPEVRRAVERGEARLGTIESWLAARICGGDAGATDPSFASASGLYEFFEKTWNDALLDRLGFPAATLPPIHPSSGIVAPCDPAALGTAAPLAGIAGDQQAAMFGQACFEPGAMKTSLGTSAMVDLHAGTSPILSQYGAYPLVLWKLGDDTTYCLEGQAVTAGAAVQWLRDGLGIVRSAEETDALARSVPDTGGAWVVPAFQGLGTPHQDPSARAALGGLSRGTSRAQVVRAVLEGVAHRCREIVEALAADSPAGRPAVLRADGGAAANDFLLQFLSDVVALPVERPEMLDAAAVGAAFLAGLAVGFWPDLDALRATWRLGRRFEPRMSADEREARIERFRRAVAAVREAPA